MISLVPAWARHYDAFWDTIIKRNLWFIKLRYGAVAILTALLLLARFVLGVRYSEIQITALITITLSILFYNILLHWVRRYIKSEPDKFNPLHFSLVQMVLDLYALTLLVYYTGTIESPLYMLYVFHMIIGSLILPGFVIQTVAYATIIIFVSLTLGEYYNFIPHHSVEGLLASSFHNDIKYVAAFVSIFAFVMIMSVILANKIAKQLYKMEQDLIESVNLINAAEAEKQKHIMSVVHEIKTPIAALHSYLDLILQKFLGPLDEKVEEKLIRARIRSDEAIQLINNVLQISKLRLVDEVVKEPVDVRQLVCFIISQQKINLETKKIKFTLKDEIKKEGLVKGDKLLLEIAFSNLIGNAIKYVGNNGMIEIKMFKEENRIVVKISDNGIGIPPNEIERVFNDFFRASNIKQKYEGSGLGLTFVKQILEHHGGNIEAKSPSELGTPENPGCCFTVYLPHPESDIKK
jgi:signal transduction histidine kinase